MLGVGNALSWQSDPLRRRAVRRYHVRVWVPFVFASPFPRMSKPHYLLVYALRSNFALQLRLAQLNRQVRSPDDKYFAVLCGDIVVDEPLVICRLSTFVLVADRLPFACGLVLSTFLVWGPFPTTASPLFKLKPRKSQANRSPFSGFGLYRA